MKRILSIVLCCTLLVGSIPVSAWATDTVEGNSSVSVSTEADSQLAQDSSETAETPSDSTEPSPQPLEETPELTEEPVEDAEETPAPTEEPVDETQESSEPTEDNTFNVGTEEIEDADTSRDPEPSAEPVDETQETPAPTEEPVDETQTGYDLTTTDDGSREVAAQATEGTVLDAAIFASDVHGNTSDLTSVLNGVKTSGVDYSSIGFVGDTCLTVANTTSTVQSALGDTNIAVMFSYAASHDTENSADISTNWNYSGEVEGVSDHYLVYTIRETDMQNASDATTAALAFTTWYNGLTEAEKKLPIFIMSHRPLHARRNDNAGASSWYNVISVAAESSDIVFFWGHNHTSENSVDTAAYYVAKDGDETFTVYNGDSVVPNFTYMNAGYINANNQSPARIGVATTVQITENELVFQDYNSSGTYTGTYAHNVTVEREFETPAVTLSSIAISGTSEYTVGDELALTVTATYSDGSTADVTAAATLSEVDMSTAGTKTVTATYEGKTATFEITVEEVSTEPTINTVSAWDDTEQVFVEVTALGLTAITVTNALDALEDIEAVNSTFTTNGYMGVNIALKGYTEGDITYSISVVPDMDTTNLELYYVDANNNLVPVEFELVTDELNNVYVVFTTTYTGTFVYGSPNAPEGYAVSTITLENIPTDLFVGGSLDLTEAVITVTYTKAEAEDFVRVLTVYDYDEKNFTGLDVNASGSQTVTFTFDGATATLDVNVWGETFTVGDVSVTVGADEYGVEAVNVSESANTNVAEAISNVITGDNYVAYDITMDFADGYATNEEAKTVTLSIPEGVVNPVVFYVSDNGATVTNMYATNNGDGTVTFTTTHFSTYVIGESTEVEMPEGETVTGSGSVVTTTTKQVYVLTDTIEAGKSYLIVNGNSAGSYYALANNSGSVAATGVTVQSGTVNGSTQTYIELTDAIDELWTVANGYTFKNGGYYLRYNSGLRLSTSESSDWTYSGYKLYSDRYLRYDNGWTTTDKQNRASNIYFYVPTTMIVETTTSAEGTYSITGEDISLVPTAGKTANLSSTLTFTPESGSATTTDVSTTAKYEIATVDANGNTINGDPNGIIAGITGNVITFSGNYGKAVVKITYTTGYGDVTNYISIEAKEPYYTLSLHLADPTYNVADIDAFADGTTYYVQNEDGSYSKVAADATFDENVTYYTLGTVTVGKEITTPVAIKNVTAGYEYSVWAVIKEYDGVIADGETEDGKDLGDVDDGRIYWTVSNTNIATVDPHTGVITFTGNEFGTFTVTAVYLDENGETILAEDRIVISASESSYVVPGDGTDDFPTYPNEGAVRFDKTATAVGNFSETGIAMVELAMTGVPYTTGAEIDVVIMLDMTGSMSDDAMAAAEESAIAFAESIVKNEDGTYNGNRIAVMAFNSNSSSPFTYWELGTITADTWDTFCANVRTASDDQTSGGTPYNNALAECQSVLAAAKTDGIGNDRQQFCVFMSDGGPTSYTYITNYDAVKAGTATAYTTATASATGGANQSDSNFATIATYTHEYYSTLMKDDGVTMYSVLTGLVAANYPNCTTIMQNIASDSSKAYVVEDGSDTSALSNTLTGIGEEIKEAATDVKIVDMIGENYTVNFSLPTGVDSTEAGMSEFYIQVVEYTLDEDKNRTENPAVLENFTFNSDGTLKSHTVDGTACGDTCSHVTFTNGIVTEINGTYFTYEVVTKAEAETESETREAGEYLTWTSEKISTTELALQYFAYLDNSAGAVGTSNEIPAGTYYTNEWATLTYTNYQGKEVQQEFPVPQMTWNGAQVSYVFYLVNEAGNPVNTAGREIPIGEAVYVTDVHTYSVIWNDLEQAAGLEASRLALGLVPEAYKLYDDDAGYKIHVYEDENKVNLNNHFVISGDVTDDYNTGEGWTNANTTYVFNNKSDAIKYTSYGTYVANGTTIYLCKGEGKVTPTISEIVGLTSETFTEEGIAYYTLVDGKYVLATEFTENTDYYAITAAEYTAVGDEIQWKPGEDDTTSGGTVIDGYVYYIDENSEVYTIVQKSDATEVREGFDFHNTTVAFAVVWEPELAEDTVVVDYGLDVVIDVITNDNMAAAVTGVMKSPASAVINKGTYETSVGQTIIDSTDGLWTASLESGTSVRFHQNEMGMNAPITFYYEAQANYYDSDNILQSKYMYSKVTVIPATTIYYEDSFVTLHTETKEGSTWNIDEESTWAQEGTVIGATQDQDRPGESKISENLDKDNNYGYDSAYTSMSTYSMGSASVVNVYSGHRAKASFDFYGTGFDVISLTSNKTGTITVTITDVNGEKAGSYVVDTYYGYAYVDGEWVTVDSNSPNALYQVPVMKVSGLTYGKYHVEINAAYASLFDHEQYDNDSYDFYLDAIRIYDPAGTTYGDGSAATDIDKVIQDAYIADDEAWPTYKELRNLIIDADTFNSLYETVTITEFADGITYYTKDENDTYTVATEYVDGTQYYVLTATDEPVSGIVFIDGGTTDPDGTVSIADYTSYGPNNEVYLAYGQAVAFDLNATASAGAVKKVQLAVKTVGGTGAVEVYGVDANGNKIACLAETIGTATDMYYDISDLNGKTVVIKNVGESSDDAIVSITNIKVTYTEAQTTDSDTETASVFSIRHSTADLALATFNVEDDTVTDDTVTDDTVTDDTVEDDTTTEDTETDDTVTDDTVTDDNVTEDDNTSGDDTVTDDTVEDDTTTEDTETDDTESDDTSTEDTTTENVVTQIVNTIKNIVNKITSFFSKWFR